METDELMLDEKNDTDITDKLPTPQRQTGIARIQTVLKNNPDIPDALREMAPFLSADLRQGVIKMAAVGDFIVRMTDDASFGINGTDAPRPVGGLYSAMKKYIPLNKRAGIDGIMSAANMLKSKMAPRRSSNGLERVINDLSRINEMSKLISGANAAKNVLGTLASADKGAKPDVDSVMEIAGNIIGKEKMDAFSEMLGKFFAASAKDENIS